MNINKTQSKATLDEQSSEGPRCQETRGVGGASARQETPSKHSYDSPRVVKTPKGDEDRYTYDELMETCVNIASNVVKQGDIIKLHGEVIERQKELLNKQGAELKKLQKVVFHQYKEIEALKAVLGRLMQERM